MNCDMHCDTILGISHLPPARITDLQNTHLASQTEELRGVARWDDTALRSLLASRLKGDQVIVVSNRQPFTHEVVGEHVTTVNPASGLVTALEPVLRACGGTWIAHGSGKHDRELVDANDRCPAPAASGSYSLRRLWLSAAEQKSYYDGFSNSGLWPLCHTVHVRPTFNELDWLQYQAVNQRFADAVVSEASVDDPIVLVQDYHLALLPAMIRSQLPRATVVSFWHIPWAHPEQMSMCPWLTQLIDGLLGSDIVGFQTPQHSNNFVELCRRSGKSVAKGAVPAITQRGHCTEVRDYPISIAWPRANEFAALPSIATCRRDAQLKWGVLPSQKLVVGVDRFDYTKGMIERLQAFEHLLEKCPQWVGVLRFVQVAAPTRTSLKDYTEFQAQVIAEVQRINAKFSQSVAESIVLLHAHHDRAQLDALYRSADVCLVTSLHDGMNLVSKEFVASRDDEQGVLVLSRFAGAANQLTEALIVNPYHTVQVADALHRALCMTTHEQGKRMRALRASVQTANVYRWAANMLSDAATLRNSPTQDGLNTSNLLNGSGSRIRKISNWPVSALGAA